MCSAFSFVRPAASGHAPGGGDRFSFGTTAPGVGVRANPKNSSLATSGPYAYTRNPLYLGNFLLGVGFTIGSGWWPLGVLFAVLFLGIYLPVMRVESETLIQLFGESYQAYARGVPLFFPRVTAYQSGEGPRNSTVACICDIANTELLWAW